MIRFYIRRIRRINSLLFRVGRLSTGAQAETRAHTQTLVLCSVIGLGTIGYVFSTYSSRFRKLPEMIEADGSDFSAKAVIRAQRQIVRITTTTSNAYNRSNQEYIGILRDSNSCIAIIDYDFFTNTNNGSITVTFHDGSNESGVLHCMDKLSGIALIKWQTNKKKVNDVSAPIRDSNILKIGEQVFGVSFNRKESSSIVLGQINELNRSIPYVTDPQQYRLSCIRVKFPLQRVRNGPFFDSHGKWIGMILPPSPDPTVNTGNNNSAVTATDTTGMILPSSTVVYIVKRLKEHGCLPLPYVGMSLLEYPIQRTDSASTSGIPDKSVSTSISSSGSNVGDGSEDNGSSEESTVWEVVIEHIVPESPAELQGLLSGDVVVRVNDKEIRGISDVVQAVGIQPDRQMQLTVRRPAQGGKDQLMKTVTMKSLCN